MSDINKWIKISNVSISPWYFTQLENRYDVHGNVSYIGVNYESAIIDKLFFDFDLEKATKLEDGTRTNIPFPQARDYNIKLWEWARQNKYRRECAFTGGGFQTFIKCQIPTLSYANVMKDLIQKLDIEYDDVISFAQLRRMIGSFNFGNDKKEKRMLFCIGLTDDEIYYPIEKLKELAKVQRKQRTLYDSGTYIPKDIKISTPRLKFKRDPNYKPPTSLDQIFNKYGITYKDICPVIRSLIEQPSVGHQHRLIIIRYLKTMFYINFEDMIQLLPLLLQSPHSSNGNDGSHSVSERQPDHIYGSNSTFNPKWMRDNGFCPQTCYSCDNIIEGMRRIAG